MHLFAARETFFFLFAAAIGAEPLKNGSVPADLKAGVVFHLGVNLLTVAHRRVEYPAAAGAEQVIMPVKTGIETVCRRDLYIADLPGRGQNAQIAVYRAPADPLILGAHVQIDLVCRRVIVPLFHGLLDQLPLLGTSPVFHRISSYQY